MSTNTRKFLHTLKPTSDGVCTHYQIAGAEWIGREAGDSHDYLTSHPAPGVIHSIHRAYEGDGYTWEWSLLLAEGVYARHSAAADSIEAAAAAAVAYAPRVVSFSYVDETTWYETAEGRFFAALDGEAAEVIKRVGSDGYRWSRHWSPAKTISEAMHGYTTDELSGTAPTIKAAMIACIEAPHRLKAACGALIASLRAASAGPNAPAPAAPAQEVLVTLEKVASDFEACGESDTPDETLLRLAQIGWLECTHFELTDAGRAALSDMTEQEGGAA